MIFIIPLAICIIGWIIAEKADCYSTAEAVGAMLIAASVAMLILALIAWPICYYSTLANIERYEAQKQTIEVARASDISEIERAAILTQISETNQALASYRYWNDTIFDIFIPDKITELEPLK